MSIEEVREYWNNRPGNIRHSNKSSGTKEYFKEVSEKFYENFADIMKTKNPTPPPTSLP